jgi:hypothetical protein
MPRRRPPSPERDVGTLRVAKTIGRTQNGAKRHSLRYGHDLVCVRHRIDPVANVRYVTVELVVEALPVALRDTAQVAIRLAHTEKETRALLLSCDARWDPQHKVWRLPRRGARPRRRGPRIVPGAE